MDVKRWQDIWTFLSLDLSSVFARELFIPLELADEQKSKIRKIVGSNEMLQNLDNLPSLTFRLFADVDPYFTGLATHLYSWGQNIYRHQGPDRTAELFWGLMFRIYMNQTPRGPEWVFQLLDHLTKAAEKETTAVREKIKSLRSNGLTPWDENVSNGVYGQTNRVLDTLSNVVEANAFLLAWDSATGGLTTQDTDLLYEIATEQQARRDAGMLPIPYPGSWKPATQWFVANRKRLA